MKVYCCQFDVAWEDKEVNRAKVRSLLARAGIEPGSMVVLPEMFSTGFSMNVAGIQESSAVESEQFLSGLAREYRSLLVGGVVIGAQDGRGRNVALVVDPERNEVRRYSKLHPFTFGGESQHYQPGTEIITFQWRDFVVAPFICYDLRFPEIFRSAVRRGAELLVVIANWPAKREPHWITLLQARAIENQAYVAGVNRIGQDPKLTYHGRSMVIDPKGEVLLDLGDEERAAGVEIDLGTVTAWRREFPALQDMHPEFVR